MVNAMAGLREFWSDVRSLRTELAGAPLALADLDCQIAQIATHINNKLRTLR